MQKGFIEPGEKPKRFYTDVTVVAEDGGFAVKLDGRNVRSPKGGKLNVPTPALAELVAGEWSGQVGVIEMADMHATRLAFTATEAVSKAREATAGQIAEYAASDVLCYFAGEPESLHQRQLEVWEPILDRAERELALVFVRVTGIIHAAQPEETLAKIKALALEMDDFNLTGVAFGTPLFGSGVLAFAVQRGWLSGEEAYSLSRVDEAYQQEKWGVDEEAAERTARLLEEARMLDRWFKALA
ncbi:ATP12 family chaperone protein [Phenylobacterium sp. Root700]|uniref:ATP12 family chaperone protein n=1 Tax=Phenylobacterium sp. Root700 TaxID=1736591 RepID=UPI0006F225DF|nr:ATP12 family protein [Phenylobacterium sp. Root700]KRB52770.1 ATPase [Phenylobacterium sp. Root700]